MRKLLLKMSMSIDGFVAGPNGELDWALRSSTEDSRAWLVEVLSRAGIHAMGRKAFHDMAAHWPTATGPIATAMNAVPKVVFTREGFPEGDAADPTGWKNPRVAAGTIVDQVAALKREDGGDILAHGGASFARSLVEHDLIDEYYLPVHPVVLGRGQTIFSAARLTDLELVDVKRFSKGIVAHVYRRSR